MRFFKRIIQWTIGITCGLYLSLQIAMHIPSVQQWAGSFASSALKELLDWDISIGRIRFGLLNRVIIDDINLKDKNDSTMLHASRLAAKIDILPLFEGRISIANAQLFGTQAQLYQTAPEDKPNFQFVLDTFASNDTTSKPLNLHIGSVLLRRVEVRWDQHWKPYADNGMFDPSHIHIKDIALTAHVRTIQNDSLNISLKRLQLNEYNGLSLKNLSFNAEIGKHGGHIDKFSLQFPKSSLSIPTLLGTWTHLPGNEGIKEWLKEVFWRGEMSLNLTPSDFKALVPRLANVDTPIMLTAQMFGSEACVNIPDISISNGGSFDFNAKAFIQEYTTSPQYIIDISRLQTNARLQHYLTNMLNGEGKEVSPILTRLDTLHLSGRIHISEEAQNANLLVRNRIGNINLSAHAKRWNDLKATLHSDGLKLDHMLSDNGKHALQSVAFNVDISGKLHDKHGKPHFNINASIPHFAALQKEYQDISILASLNNGAVSLETKAEDMEGRLGAHLNWSKSKKHSLTGSISIENWFMERLGFGEKYPNTLLSINTELDVEASTIDDIAGKLNISGFSMQNAETGAYIIEPMDMSVQTHRTTRGERAIELASTPLNISAQGKFRFSTLATTLTNSLHKKLPTLIAYKKTPGNADRMSFCIDVQDTLLLRHLALQNISIPERSHISGELYGQDSLYINAEVPQLHIGKEHLRNIRLSVNGTPGVLTSSINTERRQKNGFISLSTQLNANEDRLRLIAGIDNNRKPKVCGELDITANFSNTANGKQDIRAWIAPNDIIISDTTWRIHPASIAWDGKKATIHGFKIWQEQGRGITIDGTISDSAEDTLKVGLQDINVEYILDLVNFRSVLFQGLATGTAIGTGLLSSPHATADITVNHFHFNNAPMGTLKAKAGWGDTPYFLALDAAITDKDRGHTSLIKGGFNIGSKEIPDGLDLKINTKGFNLAFMNFFTKDILEDVNGQATGYCRIFGSFKNIDLEGDLAIDHASMKLPMLGTKYHLRQDSVHLRPGVISIEAMISDDTATPIAHPFRKDSNTPNDIPHTARLYGRLMHENFKNLHYDFDIQACRLLGYDFKDFGESSFYATCIATGDIEVKGGPGRLNVNINAIPEAGTVFTYNVSTPEALTEANFITFNDATPLLQSDSLARAQSAHIPPISSDLFINFNLQVTPAVRMRLLMDRKSGDMIEIMGRGRIMANFHNKGRFNIYGTYSVQEGSYKLSLQDIIRRDFKFRPGGTITFGGNAMKADLNLQAVYSVNGVSLDDLTTKSLGFSKTKVDCIMNLTGRPEQPQITFDFDLPNATEDENQMIRSIVSTEEERNIQAIYLLSLGRFYNFDSGEGFKSNEAMNSIVSNTISTQLNQFIENAVGSSKWSIGANLKTGDDGWRNMDVEGLLSGKLLDDRLLITGNFGYREKYYTQRSFISDVSVEYLLTKNGTISLKAYNQANDRYFVQSSLNTQGIGIQFKKDFNHFTDLFQWLIPRKKTEKSSQIGH